MFLSEESETYITCVVWCVILSLENGYYLRLAYYPRPSVLNKIMLIKLLKQSVCVHAYIHNCVCYADTVNPVLSGIGDVHIYIIIICTSVIYYNTSGRFCAGVGQLNLYNSYGEYLSCFLVYICVSPDPATLERLSRRRTRQLLPKSKQTRLHGTCALVLHHGPEEEMGRMRRPIV